MWLGSSFRASTEVPRPLKLPIGLRVSTLTSTSRPSAFDKRSLTNWGVSRKTGSISPRDASIRASERSTVNPFWCSRGCSTHEAGRERASRTPAVTRVVRTGGAKDRPAVSAFGVRSRMWRRSVEDRQVEPAEALVVAEDVDLGDPPVPDRDAPDRERLAVVCCDPPEGAVDARRLDEQAELRGDERLASDLLGPADFSRNMGRERTKVASQHAIRIEHRDQSIEVPV